MSDPVIGYHPQLQFPASCRGLYCLAFANIKWNYLLSLTYGWKSITWNYYSTFKCDMPSLPNWLALLMILDGNRGTLCCPNFASNTEINGITRVTWDGNNIQATENYTLWKRQWWGVCQLAANLTHIGFTDIFKPRLLLNLAGLAVCRQSSIGPCFFRFFSHFSITNIQYFPSCMDIYMHRYISVNKSHMIRKQLSGLRVNHIEKCTHITTVCLWYGICDMKMKYTKRRYEDIYWHFMDLILRLFSFNHLCISCDRDRWENVVLIHCVNDE